MKRQGLSARQRVYLWEHGEAMHPVDRSLALIKLSNELESQDILKLSIGHRNGLILQSRLHTFGAEMNCSVNCPECDEQLTLEEDVERFLAFMPEDLNHASCVYDKEITYCGADADNDPDLKTAYVSFRLPRCEDLIKLAQYATAETTTALLMERCILSIKDADQKLLDVATLPKACVQAVIDEMQALDPLAEIIFPVSCPECGHEWKPIFEPADYFWDEIDADCKKLFRDVHQLARYYGWTEDQILTMKDARRQKYIDMMDEAAA